MARASQQSLLRRLLAGFMLVLLAIWLCALAGVAYQSMVDQERQSAVVNKAWTRQIMLNLRSVASQPAEVRAVGAAIEQLRLEMFAELGFETDARTIVWKHGALVYNSDPGHRRELPGSSGPASALEQGWVGWVERDAATGITVERSQKSQSSWVFTPSAARYLLTPLVYSLPFLLLPAWFIVRVGLRPLHSIVAAIEQRSGSDLAALPVSPYRELSPLVDAINRLMNQLRIRLEHEQEFLSDAAHELKTPLSVIQINAHLLDTGADPEQRRQASDGLRLGVARASHTVHQLLAFERARAEPGDQAAPMCDLAALVRDRLALAGPLAMQRDIDIELHAEQLCALPLHRESMAALLDNIISNAIKYSPDAGRIDVRIDTTESATRLSIQDHGTGIEEGLRQKVFERFYRVPGQDQAGSGLGLAIAERAAARNGATISLETGASGQGLAVSIIFCHQAALQTTKPGSDHHFRKAKMVV